MSEKLSDVVEKAIKPAMAMLPARMVFTFNPMDGYGKS